MSSTRALKKKNICKYIFTQQQNYAAPTERPAEMHKVKNQVWSGVFSITLVEGQDFPQYGHGDIYVCLCLGEQKCKSRVRRPYGFSNKQKCFVFVIVKVLAAVFLRNCLQSSFPKTQAL